MFKIFVRNSKGHVVLVTQDWSKDPQSGIDRAIVHARLFGFDVVTAWAEPIRRFS